MLLIRFAQSTSILRLVALLGIRCVSAAACAHRGATPSPRTPSPSTTVAAKPALIPWPVSVTLSDTDQFGLGKDIAIEVSPNQPQLEWIAQELAKLLRPALDVAIPV